MTRPPTNGAFTRGPVKRGTAAHGMADSAAVTAGRRCGRCSQGGEEALVRGWGEGTASTGMGEGRHR